MFQKNSNSISLALMCKSHDYNYLPTTNTFITGDWVISNKRQEELIGTSVILTESQQSTAYIGGKIVGFVPANKQTAQTQCKVVFVANPDLVGNDQSSGHVGWGMGRSVCYID